MLRVLSLGAGVQSSTLALMMAKGEIEPVEHAIFADTQSEPRAVYAWLDWLEKQLPFPVHRVTAGNLAEDVLLSDTDESKYMLPTFTLPAGMGKRQCTSHYKLTPIRRKIRELSGGAPVEQVIGISYDEALRMKSSGVKYITNVYPLVERKITRGHCLEWLIANFGRVAPKSACKFCPYHDNEAWQALEPDELEWVYVFDETIRNLDSVKQYLHADRKPLREVDLRTPRQHGQTSMFGNECEGLCGV